MLNTHRRPLAQLVVGKGYCGRTERGRPNVPVDQLKALWVASQLYRPVRLTVSGCLGPCDLANVATVIARDGTRWPGRLTGDATYKSLIEWTRACHAANQLLPLPRKFEGNRFERFTNEGTA